MPYRLKARLRAAERADLAAMDRAQLADIALLPSLWRDPGTGHAAPARPKTP